MRKGPVRVGTTTKGNGSYDITEGSNHRSQDWRGDFGFLFVSRRESTEVNLRRFFEV